MKTFVPILLLAACQAESPPEPPPAVSEADPAPGQPAIAIGVIADPVALEGEYRLVGVDGQDINLPHGITVSITRDTILYQSDCVNAAWSYRFEGQGIALTRIAAEGCARGFYAEEEAIDAAFEAATHVRRTQANGIEFSGGGHSVTLFSQ